MTWYLAAAIVGVLSFLVSAVVWIIRQLIKLAALFELPAKLDAVEVKVDAMNTKVEDVTDKVDDVAKANADGLAGLHARMDDEFGGNHGGMREAINSQRLIVDLTRADLREIRSRIDSLYDKGGRQ